MEELFHQIGTDVIIFLILSKMLVLFLNEFFYKYFNEIERINLLRNVFTEKDRPTERTYFLIFFYFPLFPSLCGSSLFHLFRLAKKELCILNNKKGIIYQQELSLVRLSKCDSDKSL